MIRGKDCKVFYRKILKILEQLNLIKNILLSDLIMLIS